MTRVLKVFASSDEQAELAEYGRVLASYDAFAILEPGRGATARITRKFPSEDISRQYALRLRGRDVVPPARAGRSAGARRFRGPTAGWHHYLVQFVGPLKRGWLASVTRAGGKVRELYRDFTYVVCADARTLDALLALPCVRWIGHLPHTDRLAAALRSGRRVPSLPRTRLRTGVYSVQTFAPTLVSGVAKAAKRLGFDVRATSPASRSIVIASGAGLVRRRRMLKALSEVHGVKFVRRRPMKRTSNDVAATLMGATRVAASKNGLSGRGEIIAICDTGLDTGDRATLHADFTGRILAMKSYPIAREWAADVFNAGADDGPADLDSGHGTHVAGSVLGDGRESTKVTQRPIRGLAYRAMLVFQAVEQEMWWRPHVPASQRERYVLAGLPEDLTPLLAYAHRKGARVHSNSWGGGAAGDYDEQCEQLDRFVWKHKDMCILCAAGNDGTDKDGDGRINLKSVTSPATAKNCITVGACESHRPEFGAERYGVWWPDDFPVAPFRKAPMADDPDEVVAFSSRGPTDDGRLKPDVVAPGTFILSTRSSMIASNNTGWAAFPPSRKYFFMGGTSMATPLAAGAAALIREYLRRKRGIRQPSAALVKAVMIAGATRLPATARPALTGDNHQGYGRIDLAGSLPRASILKQIATGLATGEMFSLRIRTRSSSRLRVVLAYSDFPGRSLVNDLNLILTAPTGRKYTSAGMARRGSLILDDKNNVEVVDVAAPAQGKWRIDVVGSNVPHGPQDFALVVLGGEPSRR